MRYRDYLILWVIAKPFLLAAYNAIQDNCYQHFTVNDSYNFVDPSTHAHTQGIERLWGSVEWRYKHH